jgi:ribokinase
MGKIIVAGSINMDVVARTTHLPKPGETIFGHSSHYIPGGKGSNQAVAASRLNDAVHLIGKLGRDPFGDALTTFLQGEQLNLDYITYSETQPSGVALITVDDASENSIVVISGSNYELSIADVNAIPVDADDVIVSVFEIPQASIKALFARAKAVGATTVLNPAPAVPFIEGLFPLVDYLIVNETELAFFAGTHEVSDDYTQITAYAQQLRDNPSQTIIVTLGGKGLVCVQDEVIQIAGIAVDAVDTTGAGDCFTGALSVALFEGKPLTDALNFANTAASLSVQKLGASASMPYREAVDATLAQS